MVNQQRIEKQNLTNDISLEVNSIFYTIQGEGPFSGRPAVFLRLAGCNLQCPLCDTEYTGRNTFHIETVEKLIAAQLADVDWSTYAKNRWPAPLVVITGGEPMRQNLLPIVSLLLGKGYDVQIETNGTLYQELPWGSITIVCSPKTGSINPRLEPYIDCYKYVLQAGFHDEEDGLPTIALGHPNSGKVARPSVRARNHIIIQPADEKDIFKDAVNRDEAIRLAKKHGYIFGIQLHKEIGVA
jgi:7-carboxy-7-deazaguanine synthase